MLSTGVVCDGRPERLRIEVEPDRDVHVLVEESTLPEQIDNPDSRNVITFNCIELDDEIVDWLHAVTGELIETRSKR